MTVNDLLENAIRHEIESQHLYLHFLTIVKDNEAIAFLNELVKEEKKHEDLLETVKEMEIYDGTIQLPDEIAAEEVSDSHATEKDIKAYSSIYEILELALQREARAHAVFTHLAESSSHPELKLLFEKLAQDEMMHSHSIERKFALQRGEMGFEM